MSEAGTDEASRGATQVSRAATSAGAVAAFGILIVAFTLRTAVTSVPPLTADISKELFLPTWLVGILGMLPTALFGIAGLVTPTFMRRWSVEALAIASMVAAGVGQAMRAFAPSTWLFLVGSALALAGMGAGNVVLPPMVKKYFPRRIGLMTALYVTVISLGTTVPPLLAVPVADVAGWRTSIGSWALLNVVAMIPWLGPWARRGAPSSSPRARATTAPEPPHAVVRPWRSPAAWAFALLFGCTSLNTYALFAWLPSIAAGAGLSAGDAGLQLAIFSGLGLPISLVVPLLAGRLRNPFAVVAFGVTCFVAGYLGLWLAPGTATTLWSTLAGLGPATFPLALVLINLRTRSHRASGAVSGFAQGIGYTVACSGPLLAGILHDATGGWTASFAFLGVTLVVLAVAGWVICRPRYIDDDPGVVSIVAEPARFQGGGTPPVG
ncbi:MFS transporter [Sinomonas sp. ASV322]|uniref:CynX/NimT family MFS transporter n=1 Tax=Sinomonas sp. ASV322 TaxID=3041920 RepID=UPI0027DC0CD2|nr:MFS transporter [Sinomonas sp. ASV322]MDQ4502040.1 MFS transporter [Sinomonas sp. ASV322]